MVDTRSMLTEYLRTNIPIVAAMGVWVEGLDPLRLGAPLEPNLNHRATAFGGSLITLAILAGWTRIHLMLEDQNLPHRLVIQRTTMDYVAPVESDFNAAPIEPGEAEWERFVSTFRARGRARLELSVEITAAGEPVAHFAGSYAALAEAEAAR